MALTDRERRIVESAEDIISRETSATGDVEACLHALRKIMHRNGLTLAELFGVAGHNQAISELTRERDGYRRALDRLQRQMAKRMEPANEARSSAADKHAAEVARVIKRILREYPGMTSTDEIAAELERRKIKTARGSTDWTRMQVHRVMQRSGGW